MENEMRAKRLLFVCAILTRKRACEQLQKFGEHEQATTRLNFASKSSTGKILRAVKNFHGSFITPKNVIEC